LNALKQAVNQLLQHLELLVQLQFSQKYTSEFVFTGGKKGENIILCKSHVSSYFPFSESHP